MKTNKKFLFTMILVLVVSLMFGCSSDKGEESNFYSDTYILALDSFMQTNEELNSDMEYIAINTKTLKDATDEDIKKIFKFFEKYDVDVIDESFESLKEKGMVKEANYIEGVLLEVKTINKVSDDKLIIEGSKFRGGKAAVGIESTIIKKDNKWILDSAEMTWIS